MPGLSRYVKRRFHENLVEIQLDVVAAQEVGDDIHKPWIADVGQHDVVVVRHLVDFAHGEGAVFGQRSIAQAGLDLDAVVGDVGCAAAGDEVGAVTHCRHVVLGQQVFYNQEAVAPELLDLRAGQGMQAVGLGAHRRSPDLCGAFALRPQHIPA